MISVSFYQKSHRISKVTPVDGTLFLVSAMTKAPGGNATKKTPKRTPKATATKKRSSRKERNLLKFEVAMQKKQSAFFTGGSCMCLPLLL